MSNKKYYWLKMQKDFYKRHDIKYIEALPNGVEYVWFYVKLLLESIDHNGSLRFNEFVPYDEMMLSAITGTNIDTVRSAMKLFISLGMVSIMDDKTIYMQQIDKMIGSETDSAERQRKYREITQKTLELENKDTKDTKHKHGQFGHVLLTDSESEKLKEDYPDAEAIIQHLDSYIEEKGYKAKSHYLSIKRWVAQAYSETVQRSNAKRFTPRVQIVEPVPDYGKPEKTLTESEIENLKMRFSKLGKPKNDDNQQET